MSIVGYIVQSGKSEKRKHRPGRTDEMLWACERAQKSVSYGFSLRSVAFIPWSVNPWRPVGCLKRPVKDNSGKKIHFCCVELSTRCCFPRGCISLGPELGAAIVDSRNRGGEQTLQQQRREV